MIKTSPVVNIERTAEEWRRLYEKESKKVEQLLAVEKELDQWRIGKEVPNSDRAKSSEVSFAQIERGLFLLFG